LGIFVGKITNFIDNRIKKFLIIFKTYEFKNIQICHVKLKNSSSKCIKRSWTYLEIEEIYTKINKNLKYFLRISFWIFQIWILFFKNNKSFLKNKIIKKF